MGDRLSRVKKSGNYDLVLAVVPNEKSVWIHLENEVDGRRIGMWRIRPRHDIKLWVLRT